MIIFNNLIDRIENKTEIVQYINAWFDKFGNFIFECHETLQNIDISSVDINFQTWEMNFNYLKQFLYFLNIYIEFQNYDYIFDYIKNDIFGDVDLNYNLFYTKHISNLILCDKRIKMSSFIDYLSLISNVYNKWKTNMVYI